MLILFEKTSSHQSGFTLIEVMITVAIVAILATVAYPSYLRYVDSSRRAEGTVALLSVASELERYYTTNNSYTTDIQGTYGDATLTPANTSETGLYTVTVSAGGTTNYTLRARPTGWTDDTCGDFYLTSTGVRRVDVDQDGNNAEAEDLAATGDCWN